MRTLKRYWIDQPSTLQPHHGLHGKNVLANPDNFDGDICDCYFTDGDVTVQHIHKIALSPGWL